MPIEPAFGARFGFLGPLPLLLAAALALTACEDLPTTTALPTAPAPAPVGVAATAPAGPRPSEARPAPATPTSASATPTSAPATPASPSATPTSAPVTPTTPPVTPTSPPATPVGPGGWADPFDAFDTGRWSFAHGWANGFPFGCGWVKDHGAWTAGQVVLKLTDQPSSGKAYSAGELRSRDRVGYGRIEGRLRVASGAGVVTSFIIYTGPEEGTTHDEIDFEFLGKNTGKVQLNYFVDGVGGHEKLVELGFDAAADYHDYAIDWRPDGITWSVDGRVLHAVSAADGPLPKTAGRVMGNVWPAVGAETWAGTFVYPGAPITAAYDRIAFTPH